MITLTILLYILLMIIAIIMLLGLDFLLTAGMLYLVCWCFDWVFSWKIAIGVWLIVLFISAMFKTNKK